MGHRELPIHATSAHGFLFL